MNKKFLIPIIVALFLIAFALLFMKEDKVETTDSIPQDREIVLVHFIDNANEATTTSCGVTRSVVRRIGKSEDMLTEALKELFKGPIGEEKAEGLTSSFEPTSSMPAETKPLAAYFNKVTFQYGVATADFKKEALIYLNSSACFQESVKQPIENTLYQFPDVEEVRYSIDGVEFTEWDA